MDEAQPVRQPVIAHLQELRKRLLWSLLYFAIAGGASYIYRAKLINLIQAPLHQPLYYTTPAGGLEFVMKVCVLAGLALAIPAIIYNLVKFVEPAVNFRLKRRTAWGLVTLSVGLLAAGVTFAYTVILPLSLHFFGEFSANQVKPLISATDYLSFVLGCLLTFALLFQLPLLLVFINRIKPLKPRQLMRYQRHVIIGSLVLALILPFTYDPVTQFVMAVPIVLLYEISILLIWLANRKRPKQRAAKRTVQPRTQVERPATAIASRAPRPAVLRIEPGPEDQPYRSPHIVDLRPKEQK